MKQKRFLSAVLTGAMTVMLFAGCGSNTQADTRAENTVSEQVEETEAVSSETSGALVIAEQGIFSAGGTTIVSDGEFDPENQWEETGAGQTAHVDHANVLYQIPEEETGLPMVFLHGYGQSRMGWMTTPDGREYQHKNTGSALVYAISYRTLGEWTICSKRRLPVSK